MPMPGSPTPSEAVRQAAEDAVATLAAALAALKDSRDASCPPPTRQQVQAGAQLLRTEVAKVGLLYSQGGTGSGTGGAPSDEEATALLNGFQRAATALCMLYAGLAVAGGGPTLRSSLHQTATLVVEACSSLIRGAVLGGARGPQLMLLSGFCLDMLEAAGRAPLDARAAIGRAITLVLKQLADAERELGEALAAAVEAEAAGGGDAAADAAGAAEEEGEGSSDDLSFGGEAFTAAHLPVARATLGMLRAVVGMGKAVVRRLLSERQGLAAEAVEGWESVLYHVKGLAPLTDDLAAAAYPPQDTEELASAAEALATSCELLLDECPEPAEAPPPGGAAEPTAPAVQANGGAQQGGQALQAAMGAVQQAHAALARELAAAGQGAEAASAAAPAS